MAALIFDNDLRLVAQESLAAETPLTIEMDVEACASGQGSEGHDSKPAGLATAKSPCAMVVGCDCEK
jgi:hypothetical protein